MTVDRIGIDAERFFSDYMRVTGVPTSSKEQGDDPALSGKTLGVVNGSSWVSIWTTYFSKQILPGVKIVNVGNEGIQLNFLRAHNLGEPCPPQINIDLFKRYSKDLIDLVDVDAIMISCSTMSRAYKVVSAEMKEYNVPVIQIDEAMMEEAVKTGGKILVVATHGPTVESTKSLLMETAERLETNVNFVGATIEKAFDYLGEGDIISHNKLIEDTIRDAQSREKIDIVVLAQLSMSVFSLLHPDPEAEFGIKVLNSAETGFKRAGEVLRKVQVYDSNKVSL